MLKGILLSVVIVAGAACGKALANVHRRRADMLSELLAGMRVLRLRMMNSLEPLGILLRKSDAELLRALGNNLREGVGIWGCWEELRAELTRRGRLLDSLKESDLCILDELFSKLGTSGREEQGALFAMVIGQLEAAQQDAQNRRNETAKTYTALGALAGIGIGVLLA